MRTLQKLGYTKTDESGDTEIYQKKDGTVIEFSGRKVYHYQWNKSRLVHFDVPFTEDEILACAKTIQGRKAGKRIRKAEKEW